MSECVRYRVSGRVQGVFYRASTRRKAVELGISGRVRNLPDGSVEVLACGDAAALDTLREWLQVGPEMARVDSVECTAAPEVDPPADFRVS